MKQFMDMEKALMEENENVIGQIGLLEFKECNNRFSVKFVIYCIMSISSFCVGSCLVLDYNVEFCCCCLL